MPGYMTGVIQKAPGRGKLGVIQGDDGTLFSFSDPGGEIKISPPTSSQKRTSRFTVGSRVRFTKGSGNIVRGLEVSSTS